ncbi:MAG: carbohydrate kinase [Candidatus Accumulibacter sp.]|nr:carbohydrate kinase [Accumulibacter sp.]
MAHFLGIDIGGTVIKSGLYDEHGREKAVASLNDTPVAGPVGWSERDMRAMWKTVCATVRKVLADGGVAPNAVKGVSFSAHGKGLYAVDKDGEPVRNGVISSDNRALPTVREWKSRGIGEAAYPYAFQQVWAGHPVSILAWLKEHEAGAYRRIHRLLMAHDWIRYRLTGEFAAEITNISGSNLYNVDAGVYEPELFRLFGIEEMQGCVAPVIGSAESRAGISARAAAETGLLEGTPVYGGFFDVVSAAVCAGLADERFINVVMGTWTIETWIADRIHAAEYPYTWGRYCIPGKYFVHEGSPTSAANLEWFARTLMPAAERPYQRCDELVASLQKGETGVQFLPYLFSSNLGDNLSGGFYGLANAHGLAHLAQAVYEGICFAQHAHLERILALSGRGHDTRLRLTGGPARSKVWMQMVADIAEIPVEVMHVKESGCLGAAIAAAVGSGVHASFLDAMSAMCPTGSRLEPDASVAARYREKYAYFRQLAARLDTLPPAT